MDAVLKKAVVIPADKKEEISDALDKDLMLFLAKQGKYQALADLMQTLQLQDSVALCAVDGSEDSELTKAAKNCQDPTAKKTTVLLTLFLASHYYFKKYLSKTGKQAKDLWCKGFYKADKPRRFEHFTNMLEKLIDEGCTFENLQSVVKESKQFSAGFLKKGASKAYSLYQPSEQYWQIFNALSYEAFHCCEEDQLEAAFAAFKTNFVKKREEKRNLTRNKNK